MRAVQVIVVFMVVMGVFLALNHNGVFADGEKQVFENLMKSQLEGVKDTEIIVSRVTIPPNTTLPKHTHPGEEFGYVLDGTVIL
jgi:quercetin dioxygenase-like cupin family protein